MPSKQELAQVRMQELATENERVPRVATATIPPSNQTPQTPRGWALPASMLANSNLLVTAQPIENPDQDTLARTQFAQLTAQALQRHDPDEPLVIGLLGRWGSGKTSLLNLMEHYLLKEDRDGQLWEPGAHKPVVVRFNPWLFADQSQLSRRFFQALSLAFRHERDSTMRGWGKKLDFDRATRVAEMIEDYAKILEPLHLFGAAGQFATSGTRIWASLLRNRTNRFAQNLELLKKQIGEMLKKLDRRVVVMIDDIDRLNVTEISQVFQLARLMGDFANTSYILAFDRRMVVKVLEDVQKVDGNAYLEKIVQVSLEVPGVPLAEMQNAASSALLGLRRKPGDDRSWHSDRFDKVFDFAARQFLRTPRNVAKLFATFRFHLVLLEEDRDPVDLLGITVLQVFMPDLYESIREYQHRIVVRNAEFGGLVVNIADEGEDRSLVKSWVRDDLPALRPESVLDFLAVLFPRIGELIRGAPCDEQVVEDVRKRKGIGHAGFVDAYFRFALPSTEFSERDWTYLLERIATGDEGYAIANAADAIASPSRAYDPLSFFEKVAEALKAASATTARPSDVRWRRLARALLVVGDDIIFQTDDVASQDRIERYLLHSIEALLMAHGDNNARYVALEAAYAMNHPQYVPPRGLYVPLMLLSCLRCENNGMSELGAYRYNSFPSHKIDLGDSHFKNIEAHTNTLVRKWFSDGNDIDPRGLIDVLGALCDLHCRRLAVLSLQRLLSTPDGIDQFLLGFDIANTSYVRLNAANVVTRFIQKLADPLQPEHVSFEALRTHRSANPGLESVRRDLHKMLNAANTSDTP